MNRNFYSLLILISLITCFSCVNNIKFNTKNKKIKYLPYNTQSISTLKKIGICTLGLLSICNAAKDQNIYIDNFLYKKDLEYNYSSFNEFQKIGVWINKSNFSIGQLFDENDNPRSQKAILSKKAEKPIDVLCFDKNKIFVIWKNDNKKIGEFLFSNFSHINKYIFTKNTDNFSINLVSNHGLEVAFYDKTMIYTNIFDNNGLLLKTSACSIFNLSPVVNNKNQITEITNINYKNNYNKNSRKLQSIPTIRPTSSYIPTLTPSIAPTRDSFSLSGFLTIVILAIICVLVIAFTLIFIFKKNA